MYEGYTASARGIIGVGADIGLIGLLLFYVPFLQLLAKSAAVVRNTPVSDFLSPAIVLCGIVLFGMITVCQWITPYFTIGLLCATLRLAIEYQANTAQTSYEFLGQQQ